MCLPPPATTPPLIFMLRTHLPAITVAMRHRTHLPFCTPHDATVLYPFSATGKEHARRFPATTTRHCCCYLPDVTTCRYHCRTTTYHHHFPSAVPACHHRLFILHTRWGRICILHCLPATVDTIATTCHYGLFQILPPCFCWTGTPLHAVLFTTVWMKHCLGFPLPPAVRVIFLPHTYPLWMHCYTVRNLCVPPPFRLQYYCHVSFRFLYATANFLQFTIQGFVPCIHYRYYARMPILLDNVCATTVSLVRLRFVP